MGKVFLLDCTLRDGGYVNNWQFGKEAIIGVTNKISKTGVEFYEIGFIKNEPFSSDRAVFPNIECIEQYIPHKSKFMKYLAMIDCGNPIAIENIPLCSGKSIDGIRVIFKKEKRDFAYKYCKEIQDKGYIVFVQFVGSDSYSDIEFIETIQSFNNIKPYAMSIVDTFGTIKRKAFLRMVYLADNNMLPDIVLGYHAHNNLQQAFGNAETLVELNLKRDVCIDACVFGMGRGAGNLNLELFADFMNENYNTNYHIEPMLEIMDDYLQESYNSRFWGYCLPYYLSAVNNCHPNYAIYYAEKQSLTEKKFNELLKSIPVTKRRLFSKSDAEYYYESFMSKYYDDTNDISLLSNVIKERNVLILAPGITLNKEKDKIESLITKQNPLIISVNFIPEDYYVGFVFSSNIRRYSKLKPSNVKKIITSNISESMGFDYKLNFSSYAMDHPDIIDNSGLMLLKFLSTLSPKKVYLAGMDGYSSSNNYFDNTLDYEFNQIEKRNELIQESINGFVNLLNLEFVTTSIYKTNEYVLNDF